MKYQSINLTVVLSFFSLLLFGFTTSNAQLADEIRPFDFSNDYYKSNGLIAGLLQDRRNGEDRRSVFDTPTDLSKFTNVRIIETLPAYAGDGSTIFWNRYAVATDESFRPDNVGDRAAELAKIYPVFSFPSTSLPGSERQAAIIAIDRQYFEANQIGISRQVNVVFRERITPAGRRTLNMLAERNGMSVDGTPIIRTMSELNALTEVGLVTLQTDERAPYLVAKVIQFPERGGITPDAFLQYVKEPSGQPLLAETHFIT